MAENVHVSIESDLEVIDKVFEGIVAEIDPKHVMQAENRLRTGRQTNKDIDLLSRHLTALTTRAVLGRLRAGAANRLSVPEAVHVLSESELPPAAITTIGSRLSEHGWLSPEEGRNWEQAMQQMTTERDDWRQEALDITRFDAESPGNADFSPAMMRDLLAAETADTALEVFAESLTPEQLQKLYGDPAFSEKLALLLSEKGHLTPEEAAVLKTQLEGLQEQLTATESLKNSAESSRSIAESRERELRAQITDLQKQLGEKGELDTQLRLQIAELQSQLDAQKTETVGAYEYSAQLREQIAKLEEQLAQGTPAQKEERPAVPDKKEPKTEREEKKPTTEDELERLKKKWRLFANTLFGEEIPLRPLSNEQMEQMPFSMSPEAVIETQAHFDVQNHSRPGLLLPVDSFFGSTLQGGSVNAERADEIFQSMSAQERQTFSRLVEHLVENPEVLEELYLIVMRDLSAGIKKEASYSSYQYTQRTWVTHAAHLLRGEYQYGSVRAMYLNTEGTDKDFDRLAALLYGLSAKTGDPTLEKWSAPLLAFKNTMYAEALRKLRTSGKPIPSHQHAWVDNSRTEENGAEASAYYKQVEALGALEASKDIAAIDESLIKICFALDIANMHRRIPANMRPKVRWEPTDNGISIRNARNANSVMLSLSRNGADPSKLSDEAVQMSAWYLASNNQSSWPISSLEKASAEEFTKSLSYEQPISLELSRDRPIILFVGHNGAGKTHSMETILQMLGNAEAIHTVHCGELDSPRIANARGLIGATAHSDRLSSFQREATLLRNVFESLNKKKPGETAVLAIDEVGKGTDSRDAIALMAAAAEYCRRRGIFLVMATHHGREFLKVADTVGLRQYMRVVSPDFKTHQIKEYDDTVPSEGIEVWSRRPYMMESIPRPAAEAVVANAMTVRAAVLSEQATTLTEVPLETEIDFTDLHSLPFIENESLTDMGYSLENPGSLKTMIEQSWIGEKDSALGKRAFSHFVRGFATQMGREYPPQARRRRIATLRRLTPLLASEADRQSILTQASAVCALRASMEFNPGEFASLGKDDDIPSKVKQIQRRIDADDPFGGYGLYIDEKTGKVLKGWNSTVKAANKSDLRRQASALALRLQDASPDLSEKISRFVDMETQFTSEQLRQSDQRRAEAVSTALRKSRESRMRSLNRTFETGDGIAIADKLGIPHSTYVTSSWIETNITEPLRKGDLRVTRAVEDYVMHDMRESFQKGNAMLALFPQEAVAQIVFKRIQQSRHQEEFKLYLQRTAGAPSGTLSEKEFLDLVRRGDGVLTLIRTLDFAQAHEMSNYGSYGAEEFAGKVQAFTVMTQLEEIDTYMKATAELASTAARDAAGKDMYSVLDNEFGGNRQEMQNYNRKAALAGHLDILNQHPEWSFDEKRKRKTHSDITGGAWEWLGNDVKRAEYDRAAMLQVAEDLGFYLGVANTHRQLGMVEPARSTDGSIRIRGGIPLGLLTTMSRESIIPQDFALKGDEDVAVIGGANGNGKSQLLQTISGILLWDRATGKVPAREAILPEDSPFIMSAINAGETSAIKSSWQNESDRLASLLDRYIAAGSPRGGYLFFDEPGAGTSPEDQIGVLMSLVGMFAQRGVKVIFTNHNHLMYQRLRQTTLPDGRHIRFKPYAFLHADDPQEKFTAKEFDPERTDEIRSDGLKVATQFGVPVEITQLAKFVRELMEGRLQAELRTDITSDEVQGWFRFGSNDPELLGKIPAEISLTDAATERLLTVAVQELSRFADIESLLGSPESLSARLDNTPILELIKLMPGLHQEGSSTLRTRLTIAEQAYTILDNDVLGMARTAMINQIASPDELEKLAVTVKIRRKILKSLLASRSGKA